MSVHLLTFDSTGLGHCLFTEMMDLNTIGRLEITRATNIEFNNTTQEWEVKDRGGIVRFSDKSRSACLEWEHRNLQP